MSWLELCLSNGGTPCLLRIELWVLQTTRSEHEMITDFCICVLYLWGRKDKILFSLISVLTSRGRTEVTVFQVWLDITEREAVLSKLDQREKRTHLPVSLSRNSEVSRVWLWFLILLQLCEHSNYLSINARATKCCWGWSKSVLMIDNYVEIVIGKTGHSTFSQVSPCFSLIPLPCGSGPQGTVLLPIQIRTRLKMMLVCILHFNKSLINLRFT